MRFRRPAGEREACIAAWRARGGLQRSRVVDAPIPAHPQRTSAAPHCMRGAASHLASRRARLLAALLRELPPQPLGRLLQVAHARLVLLRARGFRDEGPRRLGAPACAGRPAGGLPRSRRPAPAARAAHGQRAPSSPHVLASTLQHAREVDLRQVQTHATTLSTALGEAQLLPARGPGRVFARACARRSCSSSAAAAVATTCALSRLNCAASRATSPTPPPAGRHT